VIAKVPRNLTTTVDTEDTEVQSQDKQDLSPVSPVRSVVESLLCFNIIATQT
jgi:hypothetical protein